MSVFDRWTFPRLDLTCSWWVSIYMGKPSAVAQPFIFLAAILVSSGAVWWTLTRWRQVWWVCSVKTVWSIHERFRGELNGVLYKSMYLYLFTFKYISTCRKFTHALSFLLCNIRPSQSLYLLKHLSIFTKWFSLSTRKVTIVDSNKDEIKLVAHCNHMVTTWSIILVIAHANFHCQLKCKLLQNIILHSPNNWKWFTKKY